MIRYAAPGDTWSVSGPTFLRAYLVVAALTLIGTLAYRWLFRGGPATFAHLGPQAAAYLNGGGRLAVYACLGGLRVAGAVDVPADRRLRQTGSLPARATPLDQAVYNAAGRRIRPRELTGDRWVIDALQRLQTELQQAGLLAGAARRWAARTGPLLLLALVAVGVARVVAAMANDKPVDFLMAALVFLVPATAVLLLRLPRRTRAGDEMLARLRVDHRHLAPTQRPAWNTYGPAGAGFGVALFGSGALWTADPAFAAAAGVKKGFATSDYADSAGASCGAGAGNSCGGGSGCGGGGAGCGGGGGCGG